MSQSIEVVVSSKGEIQVTTKGYSGSSCRQASQFLEQALGVRSRETLTTEFHQSHTADNVLREGQT